MGGVGGPRARAIETAGRWFGPLAQRKPRPAKDKAFAEIRRAWHFVDAKGEILGRLAAKIAPLLCGKHKPIFTSPLILALASTRSLVGLVDNLS